MENTPAFSPSEVAALTASSHSAVSSRRPSLPFTRPPRSTLRRRATPPPPPPPPIRPKSPHRSASLPLMRTVPVPAAFTEPTGRTSDPMPRAAVATADPKPRHALAVYRQDSARSDLLDPQLLYKPRHRAAVPVDEHQDPPWLRSPRSGNEIEKPFIDEPIALTTTTLRDPDSEPTDPTAWRWCVFGPAGVSSMKRNHYTFYQGFDPMQISCSTAMDRPPACGSWVTNACCSTMADGSSMVAMTASSLKHNLQFVQVPPSRGSGSSSSSSIPKIPSLTLGTPLYGIAAAAASGSSAWIASGVGQAYRVTVDGASKTASLLPVDHYGSLRLTSPLLFSPSPTVAFHIPSASRLDAWDTESQRCLWTRANVQVPAALSPDASTLALLSSSPSSVVKLWDVRTPISGDDDISSRRYSYMRAPGLLPRSASLTFPLPGTARDRSPAPWTTTNNHRPRSTAMAPYMASDRTTLNAGGGAVHWASETALVTASDAGVAVWDTRRLDAPVAVTRATGSAAPSLVAGVCVTGASAGSKVPGLMVATASAAGRPVVDVHYLEHEIDPVRVGIMGVVAPGGNGKARVSPTPENDRAETSSMTGAADSVVALMARSGGSDDWIMVSAQGAVQAFGLAASTSRLFTEQQNQLQPQQQTNDDANGGGPNGSRVRWGTAATDVGHCYTPPIDLDALASPAAAAAFAIATADAQAAAAAARRAKLAPPPPSLFDLTARPGDARERLRTRSRSVAVTNDDANGVALRSRAPSAAPSSESSSSTIASSSLAMTNLSTTSNRNDQQEETAPEATAAAVHASWERIPASSIPLAIKECIDKRDAKRAYSLVPSLLLALDLDAVHISPDSLRRLTLLLMRDQYAAGLELGVHLVEWAIARGHDLAEWQPLTHWLLMPTVYDPDPVMEHRRKKHAELLAEHLQPSPVPAPVRATPTPPPRSLMRQQVQGRAPATPEPGAMALLTPLPPSRTASPALTASPVAVAGTHAMKAVGAAVAGLVRRASLPSRRPGRSDALGPPSSPYASGSTDSYPSPGPKTVAAGAPASLAATAESARRDQASVKRRAAAANSSLFTNASLVAPMLRAALHTQLIVCTSADPRQIPTLMVDVLRRSRCVSATVLRSYLHALALLDRWDEYLYAASEMVATYASFDFGVGLGMHVSKVVGPRIERWATEHVVSRLLVPGPSVDGSPSSVDASLDPSLENLIIVAARIARYCPALALVTPPSSSQLSQKTANTAPARLAMVIYDLLGVLIDVALARLHTVRRSSGSIEPMLARAGYRVMDRLRDEVPAYLPPSAATGVERRRPSAGSNSSRKQAPEAGSSSKGSSQQAAPVSPSEYARIVHGVQEIMFGAVLVPATATTATTRG
ncbi:hypothetical protein BC828DRAFT_378696 [Blastocladiella britannica]|nr:hypothetical protein BC828DRAFT_378696 [Blastocladiella britannica]